MADEPLRLSELRSVSDIERLHPDDLAEVKGYVPTGMDILAGKLALVEMHDQLVETLSHFAETLAVRLAQLNEAIEMLDRNLAELAKR